MDQIKRILKKPDDKQNREFGQVLVLVCIGLGLYYKNMHFVSVAFWAILVTILVPRLFFPFAMLWFGIGEMMNRVTSWIVLNVVFFVVVVPMGLVRKWRGKDTLKLNRFKKSRISEMTVRDHLYEASDLKNTF